MMYVIAFVLLFVLELMYFKVADRYNIIDKPNERSSHKNIILSGGGIIFTVALWVWGIMNGFQYPWLLVGVTLATGVSFIDDIRPLPVSYRLITHFVAMFMVFHEIGLISAEMWYFVVPALIMFVGATNIYNFMDGINGMIGGNSLVVLISLIIANGKYHYMDESLLVVMTLAVLVFCFFNYRTKAKCIAGDVGSIGMALILLFCIGKLVIATADMTWFLFLIVFGVDGCLTIIHRIILHENLGQAHRKHAYQLMANELKIPHVAVSTIYSAMQLCISLLMIYVVPETLIAHVAYLVVVLLLLSLAYYVFKRKYYHLHEEYLRGIHSSSCLASVAPTVRPITLRLGEQNSEHST